MGSLQFIVGGRCRDGEWPHSLCNLQCKNRDAAGAKDEHRVAGLQRAIDDKGTPRCHAGGSERRSFANEYPLGARVNAVAGATTISRAYPSTPSPGTVGKSPTAGTLSVQFGKNTRRLIANLTQ